ncbi:MAG: ubiquinone/menaquinone biosynthesis methyltransferase [Desulfovibrionaceae bacterium]|nr:ubiquinone/menaquinone biosynthesis methyltransferase [Desulfovibrionaceae bacterium]
MFGGIAKFYDFLNHLLSFGVDYYWRSELAKTIPQEARLVLDLASGTLDVPLAIRRKNPHILVPALDFCHPMLKLGLPKLKGDNQKLILPAVADAKHLPLKDNSIDCLTIAFGIRNIIPRSESFAEMLRVLKPGGKACILEFGSGQELIWFGLYNFYLHHILPIIGKALAKDKAAYTYLSKTITAFPPAQEFEAEMQAAGFVNTSYRKLTSGITCLHIGHKA